MNNIWPIALCAVLLVGCASNFEQGVSAYKSGNYDLAAAMFNGPAQAGHAGSQNNLGLLWLNGYGSTPQNPEQALLWFSKAAQQGEPYAMTNIGHMYENGIFVPRNIRTAVGWYTLAARKGRSALFDRLRRLPAVIQAIRGSARGPYRLPVPRRAPHVALIHWLDQPAARQPAAQCRARRSDRFEETPGWAGLGRRPADAYDLGLQPTSPGRCKHPFSLRPGGPVNQYAARETRSSGAQESRLRSAARCSPRRMDNAGHRA